MFEKDFNDNKNFRIIIPLVFYHGEKKWNIPKQFLDLYDTNIDLKNSLLNFGYILYDTAGFDIKNSDLFHKNLLLASSFIALKTAFDKNDIGAVKTIIKNLNDLGFLTDFQKSEIFLIYILRTKNLNENEIIEIIREQNPEGGNKMLTFESYFTEKGIEKGIEQGIEKGKLEGEKNKAISTALKMHQKGIDISIISEVTELSVAEIEKLRIN